jgi:hypothetical protein
MVSVKAGKLKDDKSKKFLAGNRSIEFWDEDWDERLLKIELNHDRLVKGSAICHCALVREAPRRGVHCLRGLSCQIGSLRIPFHSFVRLTSTVFLAVTIITWSSLPRQSNVSIFPPSIHQHWSTSLWLLQFIQCCPRKESGSWSAQPDCCFENWEIFKIVGKALRSMNADESLALEGPSNNGDCHPIISFFVGSTSHTSAQWRSPNFRDSRLLFQFKKRRTVWKVNVNLLWILPWLDQKGEGHVMAIQFRWTRQW